MAGSLLGPDQIRNINETFPRLVAHIRSLLDVDRSAVGLMRVHSMVESFDSDEMARIFKNLSFISPIEKKALVRAAIYEIMVETPQIFVSDHVPYAPAAAKPTAAAAPTTYTPPPFKLNVATTQEHKLTPKAENPAVDQAKDQHASKVQRRVAEIAQDAGAKTLDAVSKSEDAKLVKRSARKNTPKA